MATSTYQLWITSIPVEGFIGQSFRGWTKPVAAMRRSVLPPHCEFYGYREGDVMDWTGCDLVERVEGRRGGQPTVIGTRIPPETFVNWAEDGFGLEVMHRNFPSVTVEQIQGILEFAHKQRAAA